MERGAHKVFDRHRAVGQKKIAQVKAAGPGDAAHAEKRDEQIDLFPEAVRGHRNENGGIAEKADRQRHRQPQRRRQQAEAQIEIQQQDKSLRAPQQRCPLHGPASLLHQQPGRQQRREDRQSHIEDRSDVAGVRHPFLTSSK